MTLQQQKIKDFLSQYPEYIFSKKNGAIASVKNGDITMLTKTDEYYTLRNVPDDDCQDFADSLGISLKELQERLLSL